ncbi:MAG: hypothetical protein Aurels2KO_51870 [Aureliella sp.]
MEVVYDLEPSLSVEEFRDCLRRSTLDARRPSDTTTLATMLAQATVIATARSGGLLVGVARAISDSAYCSYLSDLAVDTAFQKQGIGKRLMSQAHQACGLKTRLILLAAPAAEQYYPHVGLERHNSCWMIPPQIDSEDFQRAARASSLGRSEVDGDAGEFFDEIADCYNQTIHRCFPRYDEMLTSVLDYTPPGIQPKRILELGAGTGNLSQRILTRFPDAELHLVDLSQQSLDVCREQIGSGAGDLGNVHFHCGDMAEIAFEPGQFDLVYSSIAIHHLTSAKKRQLFSNCRRWLSLEGAMVFADQCRGATQASYDKHIELWKQLSMRAGTTDQEWDSWMVHQRDHDHHETLDALRKYSTDEGFASFDLVWRYLLWSVIVLS